MADASTTTSPQPEADGGRGHLSSPLFAVLPAETRNQIYLDAFAGSEAVLVLVRPAPAPEPDADADAATPRRPSLRPTSHHALLRTCRAVYAEARALYWDTTTIVGGGGGAPGAPAAEADDLVRALLTLVPARGAVARVAHLRRLGFGTDPSLATAVLDRFPRLRSWAAPPHGGVVTRGRVWGLPAAAAAADGGSAAPPPPGRAEDDDLERHAAEDVAMVCRVFRDVPGHEAVWDHMRTEGFRARRRSSRAGEAAPALLRKFRITTRLHSPGGDPWDNDWEESIRKETTVFFNYTTKRIWVPADANVPDEVAYHRLMATAVPDKADTAEGVDYCLP